MPMGYRYHNDHWVLTAKKDYGYPAFMRYMELVFAYAGTLSLEKELHKVTDANELKGGRCFYSWRFAGRIVLL